MSWGEDGGEKQMFISEGEAGPGAGDVLAESLYEGGFGPDGALRIDAHNLFQ